MLALLAAVAVTQLAEAEGRNLTVLTINVWSGLGYRGYLKMGEHEPRTVREQRTRLLIEQLRELAPDVVALNEANKLPLFVRGPGLRVTRAGVVLYRPTAGQYSSDHYGVLAEIEVH